MSKEELRELQKKIEDIMEKFIEQVESVEIKAPDDDGRPPMRPINQVMEENRNEQTKI